MDFQLATIFIAGKNNFRHFWSKLIRKSYYFVYLGFVVVCTTYFIAVAYQ